MTTLTLAAYAERHGKSIRTVQRWLERGLLPGAVLREGKWVIPADGLPLSDQGASVTLHRAAGPAAMTLAGALDALPVYLEVDEAAHLLGMTPAWVKAHARELDGSRGGPGGAWMIPQHVIRSRAGL